MADATWFTAADFYLEVEGLPRRRLTGREATRDAGGYCRKRSPIVFRTWVQTNGSADEQDRCFCISRRAPYLWPARPWARALRAYAVQRTLEELAADSLSACTMIKSAEQDLLEPFLHRLCEFRRDGPSGAVCEADPENPQATTIATCATCGTPDPFEMCANVRHVRVHPVKSEESGLESWHATALCNVGSDPGGLVPYLCRAGLQQPACFVPRVLSPPAPERSRYGFGR